MGGDILLIVICVVVLLWFALGIIYNLRRGNAVLRWMQDGLPLVGEKTTLRWLGTSVAEMVIAHARRPFKQMKVLVVLAPRDVPWFWLLASMRKRGDLLIFRSELANPPHLDLELVNPNTWTGRMAHHDALRREWKAEPQGQLTLLAPAEQMDQAIRALPEIQTALNALGADPVRCAIRREEPHLEVHLPPTGVLRQDAKEFFHNLQVLVAAASQAR